MDQPAQARGFTLIELLVVVTIIVVLLALLTPALDRAVYQAQLAACGANVDATITGAQMYAHANKRMYPERRTVNAYGERPIILNHFSSPQLDERPMLRDYIGINAGLNCPLAAKVDIAGSPGTSVVFSTYALWFGFGYTRPGETALRKLGDRFTSTGDSFSVLASDFDGVYLNTDGVTSFGQISSHPDADGVLVPFRYDNEPFDWVSGTGLTGIGAATGNFTMSYWSTNSNPQYRGTLDTNYGFEDGSVRRFDRIPWNEGDPKNESRRMVWVQEYREYTANPSWKAHLPRQ